MTTLLGVGLITLSAPSLALLALILRQRHRNAVTAAYCDGFRDGVAYEGKAQVARGERVLVRNVK